ncbi:Ubiquitin carboxyl-terminal hydrolase [Thalictrum thalictroides]|uniref:Ubiquitin carboxyl-terminal hydrolase n=1 Tax=Thalictrum thalictroides TaxID=46969 RepID=A0A7J6V2X0_THATH|nr:Ubiquitin carboxyl-terminal hydrolase [Thalictrum thalictroides]
MTIPPPLVSSSSSDLLMMDNHNAAATSSCTPSPDQEKQIIRDLMDASGSIPKQPGDLFYLLSNRWFMQWLKYTGQDSDENSTVSKVSNGILLAEVCRPGQIDNYHLVMSGNDSYGDDLELIRTLQEGHDYVLVSQEVWKRLYDWYKGGPALPRKMISQGVVHKTLLVEVYPLCLQLIDARDDKQYVIRISKKASVRDLYNQVSMLLGLDEKKFRIWDYFNKKKSSVLTVPDQDLEDANLQMDQDILVEECFWPSGLLLDSTGNGLALVPVEPSRSSVTIAGSPTQSNGYSSGYISNFYEGNAIGSPLTGAEDGYHLSKMTKGDRGGLSGLQNLGNTCFMNSSVQCLVHTPPLVEYFLHDYSDEINKQNPIGMQGELAIAFGELLRKLWSSGRAPIAPREFKTKLARFAPQFSGYNQHDSHELLAFLLDGLHEDLNRVKFKPYIEIKDANGRPDEEVADECWEIHKARNNSVIVDVCQGQYKSTLVCPVCSKVSVTFDPFMYLSLPLPSTETRSMTITVFYGDGSALPMPYTVIVPKHGLYKDLFQALGVACCLKSDELLLLAEVYEHGIFRYLENPLDQLCIVKDEEHIVAYRLPKKQEGFMRLEIVHQSKENSGVRKRLGTPLVTFIAEVAQKSADVQNAVQMVLSPLLKLKVCHPSNCIHTSMEDGLASENDDDGLVDAENSGCRLRNQSVDKMEVDQLSNGMDSFILSLTDEKGMHCSSIENDFHFRQDHIMRVTLDWSGREYDMYDISYLEDLPMVLKAGFTTKMIRPEAISLFSCLEAFLKEEPLGPDDMWYCPTCKEHRQATKKLDLWRLPEILVVHLKRFSYSRYLKNKLDTFVNFPTHNLDLRNYVKSNAAAQSHTYELYAISNHYGGLGGGHYSAYAKLSEENKWYHFDDSHVSFIKEDEIKTSAAYVLFYQRVEEKRKNESSQVHSSRG